MANTGEKARPRLVYMTSPGRYKDIWGEPGETLNHFLDVHSKKMRDAEKLAFQYDACVLSHSERNVWSVYLHEDETVERLAGQTVWDSIQNLRNHAYVRRMPTAHVEKLEKKLRDGFEDN